MHSGSMGLIHFTPALDKRISPKFRDKRSLGSKTERISYPSFRGRTPASPVSSATKRCNTRSNTKHEALLRSELHQKGLRFRKNVSSIQGNPDIVFTKACVVVFCDGDFWHGRDWDVLSVKLAHGTNASYWLGKIAANRDRDHRVTEELTSLGWDVVRVWEKDILRDVQTIAHEIATLVYNKQSTLARCRKLK